MVSFAGQIHAEIVAEGIERASELSALRGLGVGQGNYLARPGPATDLPTTIAAIASAGG